MAMVRPIWEDATEVLPRSNHAIMTLLLHEGKCTDQMRGDSENIRQQLRELEPALLLLVKKLRRIDVIFYREDGQQDSTILTMCQLCSAR